MVEWVQPLTAAPSLFRHRLDHLCSILLHWDHKFEQLLEVVQFLSCT